ncbi:MAG: hypothetical protein ISS55_02000 [Dehalococcoidales bacterium]|nr:hypothetical protein [Dehalococcoidales bacterium]
MNIKIPRRIFNHIETIIKQRANVGKLDKPIVFAMYTTVDDHSEIIDYKEIPTVKVTGDYPCGDYDYKYPGISELDFYPKKSSGRWFSGTLVFGDGTELDESDKKWMLRDEMYFRIKVYKGGNGKLQWKAYYLDYPEVSLLLS